eukprot:Hpha_TRINITY_DN15373_c2_g2::TRINITY_DN15373_c2_g2_i1::g.87622::m.87622
MLARRVQRGLLGAVFGAATVAASFFEPNQKHYPFVGQLDCSTFKEKYLNTFGPDEQQAAAARACDCDTPLKGSVVEIEDGYVKGRDQLVCDACTGFTVDFQTDTGLMFIKPSGAATKTIKEFSDAIQSVHFITSDTGGTGRELTYNFGHGFYSSHTGHYYEYYSDPGIQWFAAQTKCSADDHKMLGLVGYLITITSEDEENVAHDKLGGQGWMGSSDAGTEDTWRWVVGPEGCPNNVATGGLCDFGNPTAGTYPQPKTGTPAGAVGSGSEKDGGMHFYTDGSRTQPMDPTTGAQEWSYWQSGEPNDYKRNCPGSCSTQGEDFGHFLNSGQWNDYPQDHPTIDGYICEWGGIGDLCLTPEDARDTKTAHPGCSAFGTAKSCTDTGYCNWDDARNPRCQLDGCASYDSEKDCDHDPRCKWTVDNAGVEVCSTKYCVLRHGDQSTCNNDPQCHWTEVMVVPETNPTSTTMMCQEFNCAVITDRCECSQHASCRWVASQQGGTGTCAKDGFDTCPGADIVFVMDASGSMNAKFGSHSNGYYGMIEQIRAWVKEAPFTGEPSSVQAASTKAEGFRAGFVSFGRPTQSNGVNVTAGLYVPSKDYPCVKSPCACTGKPWCLPMDLPLPCASQAGGAGGFSNPDAVGCVPQQPGGFGTNYWYDSQNIWQQQPGSPWEPSPKANKWKAPSDWRPKLPVSGTTGESVGHISGQTTELSQDLTWHEEYFYKYWSNYKTILLPSLNTAEHWFTEDAYPKDGPLKRKHILFILTDGALHDKDQDVLAVEERLKNDLGVEVFGVVLRKGQGQTSASRAAEKKLKPLVTEPDTHFLSIPLSNLKTDILDKLCDPTSVFGKAFTKDVPLAHHCPILGDESTCMQDDQCKWDQLTAACVKSECVQACNQQECDAFNGLCNWNPTTQMCTRNPSCSARTSSADCSQQACCEWTGSACVEDYCCIQTTQGTCAGLQLNPRTSCSPAFQGQEPATCPGANPLDCTLPENACSKCCDFVSPCIWEPSRTPACQKKPCLTLWTDTDCQTNPSCVWKTDVTPHVCTDRPCNYDNQADCKTDPGRRCEWDVTKNPMCQVKYCAKYTDEAACGHDPICHYDCSVQPCVCKRTTCGEAESQAACQANPDCTWLTDSTFTDGAGQKLPTTDAYGIAPAYCKPHTCSDYNSPVPIANKDEAMCLCNKDKNCVWHGDHCAQTDFDACPDLDVLMILDGSGSMQRQFGQHSHGFMALMEMLRDWMTHLPLTGTGAGASPPTNTGQFRIGFIQFSRPGPSGIRVCDTAGCTGGKLSGKESELQKDIDYHEANYIKSTTVLLPALTKAIEVFKDPTIGSRKKVIVIICDGQLKDNPLSQLDDPLDELTDGGVGTGQTGLGVTIFGVVMRRFTQHTQEDYDAEALLKPIVSSPQDDHFVNLPLDDIPSQLLDSFCDPNSKIGKAMHAGSATTKKSACSIWGFPDECNVNPDCEWQQPALKAEDCSDASECPSLGCQRVPAQFDPPWDCTTCRPQRSLVECGMQYVPSYTLTAHCGTSSCKTHCNSGECTPDPKCKWDATTGQCIRKVCEYTSRDDCINDPDGLCQWTGGNTCETKTCESVFVKEKCEAKGAAPTNCKWDTGLNPPVCRAIVDCPDMKDKTSCLDNPACAWDACSSNLATTKQCNELTTDILCTKTGGCVWDFDIPSETFLCTGTPVDNCATNPGTCRYKKCVYTKKDECTQDIACVWDTSKDPVTCREDVCFPYPNTNDCTGDPKCVWVTPAAPPSPPPAPYCKEGCGAQTTQGSCETYGGCAWDPSRTPPCFVPYCAGYADNEALCNNDPRCHWNAHVTPATCSMTKCMTTFAQLPAPWGDQTSLTGGKASCDASPECASGSDANGDFCKPITCGDATSKCDCDKITGCTWTDAGKCVTASFSTCPDLDVVFIIDGSGSMAAPFGHHPHGFIAMMEMLRDWVKTLPLTGEDKSVGKASSVTGGTIRLAFIQFSGRNRKECYYQTAGGKHLLPAGMAVNPCAGCTDGHLSGVLSELDNDLEWHEANYIRKGTMLELSMGVALEVFQQDSPKHRAHVLIIVTDGELFDPQKLPPIRNQLDQVDVQTFGVVVRKGKAHTSADLKAEQTLKPITSDSHDHHFINVEMDNVPSTLLNDFCDPNSIFGAQIVQRFGTPPVTTVNCENLANIECLQEPRCDLNPFPMSPPSCDDGSCPNLNCASRPDALKAKFTCDECSLGGGDVSCQAGATAAASTAGFCNSTRCSCYTAEGTCNGDAGCEWKGTWTPPTCVRKVCEGLPQSDCSASPNSLLCLWDTAKTPATCVIKPCAYFTDTTCTADTKCFWNLTATPPQCDKKTDCNTHNTPQVAGGLVQKSWPQWNNCLADPSGQCVVDDFCPDSKKPGCTDTKPTCRKTFCPHTDKASCTANPKCVWDGSVMFTSTVTDPSVLCVERKCYRYDDQNDCTNDPLCDWDNSRDPKCFEDECASIPGEAQCQQNHHCRFDVALTPASCTTRYCWGQYKTNELGCKSDPKCMFDNALGSGGECTEKTCAGKYALANYGNDQGSAACACRADKDCDWDLQPPSTVGQCVDKSVGGCPPLDLTIVLDGSGSMVQTFSPHPNGFFALLEVVRDWIKTLPLTGTKTGVIPSTLQTGFRVSLIQFSGINNPGAVNLDPGTNGMLTGDRAELMAAVDWHEANPIFRKTYIQKALETAVEAFRTSPPNRADVLLIFTDGALNDPQALGPVEAELMAEGVKTFGIVVRRFPMETQVDQDAVKTLREVVSDPKDDHVMNLQVDEIASKALDSFCSQAGPFGAFIVAGSYSPDQLRSCGQAGSAGVCNTNPFCEWDLMTGSCQDHTCRLYCSKDECDKDPACLYNVAGQECGKKSCNTRTTETDCKAQTDPALNCAWDATRSPKCQPATGCQQWDPSGKTVCDSKPDCMWLGGYTIGGAGGTDPPFQNFTCSSILSFTDGCSCATTVKGSFVEIEQNFDGSTDTLSCGAPCQALGIKESWDRGTGLLHLESDDGSLKTLEQYSQALAAVKFTTTSKNGLPRKITRNFGHGFYSSVTGHYYAFFPHLKNEATVEWQDAQDRCAADDNKLLGLYGYLITVTSAEEEDVAHSKLRGQGWMGASDAAKEGEWRWVTGPEGCPPKPGCQLDYDTKTGDAMGPDAGKGLQFWEGKGSSGRITTNGYAHWQRNEPNHYTNNCPGSCTLIGEDFAHFLGSGEWNDYPYDHRAIDGYICEWGGIGKLCLSAKDAHATVVMGATVGQCVEKCAAWKNQPDCSAQGCRWDGTKCLPPDACTPLPEADCSASADCFYDATVDPKRCTPVFPTCEDIKNQPVCDGYPLCEPTPGAAPSDCQTNPGLVCQWVVTDIGCPPTVCGMCTTKPCVYDAPGTCNADNGCMWSTAGSGTITDQCVPKTGCTDKTTQTDCDAFTTKDGKKCVWDASKTPKCDLPKCAKLLDAPSCNLDQDCLWDVSLKPPICVAGPCSPYKDTATCNADGKCGWDKTQNKCVVKHCGLYDDRCLCIADTTLNCAWNGGKQICQSGALAGCPELDLVILFDGSGSMTKEFVANHPSGFQAMLESFRSWTSGLPLTGDKAGQPVQGSGFRIGMIQFSEPDVVKVDTTTKGALTGDLTEIGNMITWHEQNHIMRRTFLKLGMEQAVKTFQGAANGRKRVLLVVTDGKINDLAELKQLEQELVSEGVTTFGVVLRQAMVQTSVDLDAFEDLKEVVTEPKDLHALDVTMDEFGTGVLGTFCDASGPFGKFIAAASTSPACAVKGQADCEGSNVCLWNRYTASCGDHPCAMHCGQPSCQGDTSNNCQWSNGQCVRGPCCLDNVHGTCTSNGCCDCVTGWQDCNIEGKTASCHLFQNSGSCSWCNADTTCSGHGACLASALPTDDARCNCWGGWGGIDCSVPPCSPQGAVISQTYPSPPLANQAFRVIVHGCSLSGTDSVKMVKVPASCATDQSSSPDCGCNKAETRDCTWPKSDLKTVEVKSVRDGALSPDGSVLSPFGGLSLGQRVVEVNGVNVEKTGIDLAVLNAALPAKLTVRDELVMLEGSCDSVVRMNTAILEPNSTRELAFSAYATFLDPSAHYQVCWRSSTGSSWTPLLTQKDGSGTKYTHYVCKSRDSSECSEAGVLTRGAADLEEEAGKECHCHGLRAGDDGCLHWSWFLVVFLLGLVLLGYVAYKVKKTNEVRKSLQAHKYADLSMEAMAKENMGEKMLNTSQSGRQNSSGLKGAEDREDV